MNHISGIIFNSGMRPKCLLFCVASISLFVIAIEAIITSSTSVVSPCDCKSSNISAAFLEAVLVRLLISNSDSSFLTELCASSVFFDKLLSIARIR